MARPKDIGTAAETAVVRALRQLGFPNAERRALAGSHDLGDITGTPGIVWEIKGGEAAKSASDGQVEKWLDETERERINAGAKRGILVLQRAGIGPDNAQRWWAITRDTVSWPRPVTTRQALSDLCLVLRCIGYGEPFPAEVSKRYAEAGERAERAEAELAYLRRLIADELTNDCAVHPTTPEVSA